MIQKRKDKVLSTLISLALVMGTCFPALAFASAANANEAPENMIEAVEASDDITAGDVTDTPAADIVADADEEDDVEDTESTPASQPATASVLDDEPQIQTFAAVRTAAEIPTADNRITGPGDFYLTDPNGNTVGFYDADGGHWAHIDIYKDDELVGNVSCLYMAGDCSATVNLDNYDFKNGDIIRLCHIDENTQLATYTAYVYYVGEENSATVDRNAALRNKTTAEFREWMTSHLGEEVCPFCSMSDGDYSGFSTDYLDMKVPADCDDWYSRDWGSYGPCSLLIYASIKDTLDTYPADSAFIQWLLNNDGDEGGSEPTPSIPMPTADNRLTGDSRFYLTDPNSNKVGFTDVDGGHSSSSSGRIEIYKDDEHVGDVSCPGASYCSEIINLDNYGFKNGDIIRLCHIEENSQFSTYTAYVYYVNTGIYRVIAETDNYLLARPADVVPDFNDASYVVHDDILDGFDLDTDEPWGSFFTIEDDELRYWTRNALVDVNMVIDGVDYGRVKADGSSTLTVDLSTFAPSTYDVKFYLSDDDPATAITVATLEKKNESTTKYRVIAETDNYLLARPAGLSLDEFYASFVVLDYLLDGWGDESDGGVQGSFFEIDGDELRYRLNAAMTRVNMVLDGVDYGTAKTDGSTTLHVDLSSFDPGTYDVKFYRTTMDTIDDAITVATLEKKNPSLIDWTVITDGIKTTIEVPYGDKPAEGTDFTVPERYGYTPIVEIDDDTHTVTITYISNLVDWTIRYTYPDGTESIVNSSVITGSQPELDIKPFDGYTPHTEVNELTNTITVSYTRDMTTWTVITDGNEHKSIQVPSGETPEYGVDFTATDKEGYHLEIIYDPENNIVFVNHVLNTTIWTVIMDGEQDVIELPEGEKPIEGTDFTIPARDGYTPAVFIDEDSRTVTITYTKDETPEQPLPPVIPIVPGDDDVVLPPSLGGGNDDNTGSNDNLVETGKPSVPEQNIDSNKTPEANVSVPAPAPVADTTTDASDDEIAPQNASDASTSDEDSTDATDDSFIEPANSNADIPENDTPLSGEENDADNGFMGWVIGGTGGAVLLVGLIWFIAWRRGKWTIMSENLPDELSWSTKIKCRKDDESIEEKLEDFEIPVVPGYVVSQRFIDEDEREVIYFYIAQ